MKKIFLLTLMKNIKYILILFSLLTICLQGAFPFECKKYWKSIKV